MGARLQVDGGEVGGDMMKDLIILYSGGADSTLLLEMALKIGYRPLCLIFDYGQIHSKEIEFAKAYCGRRGVSFQVIKANLEATSFLLGNDIEPYPNVHEMFVPSRNLRFIADAAAVAETNKIGQIWYGADYSDRINLFPDCYQEWVVRLNELLKINGSFPIQVEAPLLGFTKDMVIEYLETYGVKEEEVYSGYGDN